MVDILRKKVFNSFENHFYWEYAFLRQNKQVGEVIVIETIKRIEKRRN